MLSFLDPTVGVSNAIARLVNVVAEFMKFGRLTRDLYCAEHALRNGSNITLQAPAKQNAGRQTERGKHIE